MLSPYLFALYINSVVDRVKSYGLGCYIKAVCKNEEALFWLCGFGKNF